jgi:hypothetical protein
MVAEYHRFQPYGDALVALWSGVACKFGRGGVMERPYKEATATGTRCQRSTGGPQRKARATMTTPRTMEPAAIPQHPQTFAVLAHPGASSAVPLALCS